MARMVSGYSFPAGFFVCLPENIGTLREHKSIRMRTGVCNEVMKVAGPNMNIYIYMYVIHIYEWTLQSSW